MGANIKIHRDGPAVVTGIKENPVITVTHVDGTVEQKEYVAICRCGKTKDSPFCDGSHLKS